MKPKAFYKNNQIEIFSLDTNEDLVLPVFKEKISAGGYGSFASPALDFAEDSINLSKLLIADKDCSFFARITGDSMMEIGIFDRDIIIIEKGLEPNNHDIVVAYLNGEFFIKRFKIKYSQDNKPLKVKLQSENKDYSDFDITKDSEFMIWGVVRWNLHKFR